MWNKAGHTVAYLGSLWKAPKQNGKYGLNVLSTWWYDEAKAKKTARYGRAERACSPTRFAACC